MRRRHPAWRLLTWPLSILLIVATVATGDLIIRHTPGSEEVSRPFVHSGHLGDEVDGGPFTVVVSSVRGATQLSTSDGEFDTEGIFVVVRLVVRSRDATISLLPAAVHDRSGRRFDVADRVDSRMSRLYSYQPGIPVEGEMVFEVPRDAPVGLALQVWTGFTLIDDYEPMAEIDLGITQPMLDAWLAEGTPADLMSPEVQ